MSKNSIHSLNFSIEENVFRDLKRIKKNKKKRRTNKDIRKSTKKNWQPINITTLNNKLQNNIPRHNNKGNKIIGERKRKWKSKNENKKKKISSQTNNKNSKKKQKKLQVILDKAPDQSELTTSNTNPIQQSVHTQPNLFQAPKTIKKKKFQNKKNLKRKSRISNEFNQNYISQLYDQPLTPSNGVLSLLGSPSSSSTSSSSSSSSSSSIESEGENKNDSFQKSGGENKRKGKEKESKSEDEEENKEIKSNTKTSNNLFDQKKLKKKNSNFKTFDIKHISSSKIWKKYRKRSHFRHEPAQYTTKRKIPRTDLKQRIESLLKKKIRDSSKKVSSTTIKPQLSKKICLVKGQPLVQKGKRALKRSLFSEFQKNEPRSNSPSQKPNLNSNLLSNKNVNMNINNNKNKNMNPNKNNNRSKSKNTNMNININKTNQNNNQNNNTNRNKNQNKKDKINLNLINIIQKENFKKNQKSNNDNKLQTNKRNSNLHKKEKEQKKDTDNMLTSLLEDAKKSKTVNNKLNPNYKATHQKKLNPTKRSILHNLKTDKLRKSSGFAILDVKNLLMTGSTKPLNKKKSRITKSLKKSHENKRKRKKKKKRKRKRKRKEEKKQENDTSQNNEKSINNSETINNNSETSNNNPENNNEDKIEKKSENKDKKESKSKSKSKKRKRKRKRKRKKKKKEKEKKGKNEKKKNIFQNNFITPNPKYTNIKNKRIPHTMKLHKNPSLNVFLSSSGHRLVRKPQKANTTPSSMELSVHEWKIINDAVKGDLSALERAIINSDKNITKKK
ncbi:hypothetical protein M0813_08159 [Anaeramoeba flamelloides]|uniref:Uncharacterized protein n=1 Tax=Anaeramoeba flamelloides TaxID=1746091 RepID=A0ABQ8X9A0_9EUKA|nr:hypothetical protein M0813_08159 [Anaeramoeba flamelloides]